MATVSAVVTTLPSGVAFLTVDYVLTEAFVEAFESGVRSTVAVTALQTVYQSPAYTLGGYFSNGVAYDVSGRPFETALSNPSGPVTTVSPSSGARSTASGTERTTVTPTNATPQSSATSGVQQTTTPEPQPSANDTGLSRGAVAGIAVACLVVAALVAGVAVWALMRRRLKHYRNLANGTIGAHENGNHLYEGNESPGAVAVVGHTEKGSKQAPFGGPDTSFLGGILPASADDREIKQRVSGTLEAASIHVDNFYDNNPVIASPEEQARLAKFDSSLLPASMPNLLATTTMPKKVITRALTEALTSSISPQTANSRCLLPAEYSALPRSLKGTDRNSTLGERSSALFWWRQLSVHLSPSTESNKSYLESRTQTMAELIDEFQTAFRPWRKSKYTDKQEIDALTGTFSYAAETGIWLFGQRSSFEFIWSDNIPKGELETRPALIKVSDVNGQPLAKPRSITQRNLERI